jgi:hypothetical protein
MLPRLLLKNEGFIIGYFIKLHYIKLHKIALGVHNQLGPLLENEKSIPTAYYL